MTALTIYERGIPAMSQHALDTVGALTAKLLEHEQESYGLWHKIHGGMYVRTVTLPPGLWTGAEVQAPTVLTIVGDADVYIGEAEPLRVTGVTVLPASAGRRQAFLARTEITVIMTATCHAKTVEEAQSILCAEAGLLPPVDPSTVEITGE